MLRWKLLAALPLLVTLALMAACGDSGTDPEPGDEPSESRLVFTSDRSGDRHLYSMKLDGSDIRQITSGENPTIFGAGNADATLLVYESSREDQQDLYVADYDGGNEVRITDDGFSDYRPVFSPASNLIRSEERRVGKECRSRWSPYH